MLSSDSQAQQLLQQLPFLLPLVPLQTSSLLYLMKASFKLKANNRKPTQQQTAKYQLTPQLRKYFRKRYFFFSKFDKGIQLDAESWYSVIAEPVSKYIKRILEGLGFKGTILDPFCGVGGFTIHLADIADKIVASDLVSKKVEMLRHNAQLYGVQHKFQLQAGDFFTLFPFPCELILICPPWGGSDISRYAEESIEDVMQPPLGDILTHACKFSKNMIVQMPKNISLVDFFTILRKYTGIDRGLVVLAEVDGRMSQLLICVGELFIRDTVVESTLSRYFNADLSYYFYLGYKTQIFFQWYYQSIATIK